MPIMLFLASYAGLSGIASCARRGSRSVALQPSGERLLWPCRSARRSARFGPDLELRHTSVGGGRNASLVAKAPTVEVGPAPRVRRPGASVQLGVAGSAAGPFAVLLHTCGPRASRAPPPPPHAAPRTTRRDIHDHCAFPTRWIQVGRSREISNCRPHGCRGQFLSDTPPLGQGAPCPQPHLSSAEGGLQSATRKLLHLSNHT